MYNKHVLLITIIGFTILIYHEKPVRAQYNQGYGTVRYAYKRTNLSWPGSRYGRRRDAVQSRTIPVPKYYGSVNSIYPPIGSYYRNLPARYSREIVNENVYFYSDGAYFTEAQGRQGYVVTNPPQLPAENTDVSVDDSSDSLPDPFEILRQMSDYLGQMDNFSFRSRHTFDKIRKSGRTFQLSSKHLLYINRPNKLVVDLEGEDGSMRFWYDGKTLSALDRRLKRYASVEVPNTIEAMLDHVMDKYGIVMPMSDLLYTDPYKSITSQTQNVEYVGIHRVGRFYCHHLAFASPAVDWEIWIQRDIPLPRKIRILYKNNPTMPRYEISIDSWQPSATKPAHKFFEYVPPQGVNRIAMDKILESRK